MKLIENLALDVNRTLVGAIILLFFIASYFLKLDYLVLSLVIILTIYDLYKSNFIENKYSFVILLIFLIIFPFIYLNKDLIYFFNLFLVFFVAIIIFKPSFYIKYLFLITILIFSYNFFVILFKSRELFFFIFLIAFFNDTVAYIFGKIIKGPLIIPSVSPNKTWSGTLISFLLTCALIFIFEYDLFISIIMSISLFFGDIFFSLVKRKNNLKDFSSILCGHGGILDRLDSIFFFIVILNYL